MIAQKDISVIICTYNRKIVLKKCLDAILNQNISSSRYEVIVVIDGSTDSTAQTLKNFSPKVKFSFFEQQNKGAAAARNKGAKEAKGIILVFIDDDIIASPEFLNEHLKFHSMGHSLVIGNIPLFPFKRTDFLMEGTKKWAQTRFEKMAQDDYKITFKDFYTGNFSVVHDLFIEYGEFDERFNCYGLEDREFAYRLFKSEINATYNPMAVAYQYYRKNFFEYCDNYYWAGRGEVKLAKKYPELRRFLRLGKYNSAGFLQSFFRQIYIKYPGLSAFIMVILKILMEVSRKAYIKGIIMGKFQSVIRDYFFWTGVREELGGKEKFLSFIYSEQKNNPLCPSDSVHCKPE